MQQQEKEFELFYNKYFKLAMHSAIKFTKDAEQSQELVNDCFMGVWSHWNELINEVSRLKYLQKSVRNRCINLRQKQHLASVELKQHHFDKEYDFAEINAFVITAISKRIIEYIKTLHPQRRRIMELIVSGKSNFEIGRELGISNKTVHTVKARFMPKLIKLALQ